MVEIHEALLTSADEPSFLSSLLAPLTAASPSAALAAPGAVAVALLPPPSHGPGGAFVSSSASSSSSSAASAKAAAAGGSAGAHTGKRREIISLHVQATFDSLRFHCNAGSRALVSLIVTQLAADVRQFRRARAAAAPATVRLK